MTVLVLMGVSGSGKTTLAEALVARLGWPFQEGDALHPAGNVAKMQAGTPLTDADRWPWLDRIAAWIDARLAAGENGIVTCSALRRAYRDRIVGARGQVRLVFLHGSQELIAGRLAARRGHFMPPSLLASQFATLEPPAPEEEAIAIDIAQPVGAQVEQVLAALEEAR